MSNTAAKPCSYLLYSILVVDFLYLPRKMYFAIAQMHV